LTLAVCLPACNAEETESNAKKGSWTITVTTEGGSLCCVGVVGRITDETQLSFTVTSDQFDELSDGRHVVGIFDSSTVSGSLELGIGACTADAAAAVTFEADCFNDSQCRGTWMAPDSLVPNAPPSAHPDEASVANGETVVIDVLANDEDPEMAALTLVSVASPDWGEAVITVDDQVAYTAAADLTPGDGFTYGDTFLYTMADDADQEASAMVSVQIEGPVRPPDPDQDISSGGISTMPSLDNSGATSGGFDCPAAAATTFRGRVILAAASESGDAPAAGPAPGCIPTGCPNTAPWDCGDGCYESPPSGTHACRMCPT